MKSAAIKGETGMEEGVQKKILRIMMDDFIYKMRIFTSSNDYVNEFSSIKNLNIGYFKDALILLIFSYLIILTLYVLIKLRKTK